MKTSLSLMPHLCSPSCSSKVLCALEEQVKTVTSWALEDMLGTVSVPGIIWYGGWHTKDGLGNLVFRQQDHPSLFPACAYRVPADED